MDCAVLSQPYNHISFKRRRNTWYSVKDGNWTDPTVWQSNASKRWAYPGQNIPSPVFPQVGDDVYVNHSVVYNAVTVFVNNLYVSGTLSVDNTTTVNAIHVYGNLQATGAIDLTKTNQVPTLNLYGANNYINTFTAGTRSIVNYVRLNNDQPVLDLSYFSLGVGNGGTKYLVNNLSIAGALTIGNGVNTGMFTTFELSTYNLSVAGTTTHGTFSYLSKTGAGTLLFVGLYNQNNNAVANTGISFTGNPSVEFRGGLNMSGNTFTSGTGTWAFTTNTQNLSLANGNYNFDGNISIAGGITFNNALGNSTGIMVLNAPINCTSAGGSFVNKNIVYFNSTASLPSMTTGTFDRTTNANTVGYTMAESITLPYTTYYSLVIGGAGIKTPPANLTLPGSLTINVSATLSMAALDLSVTGQTTNNGTLSKAAAGSLLFTGTVIANSNSTFDLTGTPSVELRGSLSVGSNITYNGAVTLVFTTNNQSLTPIAANSNLYYNVLISGAITVTSSSTNSLTVTGTINGNNSASTFDNRNTNVSGLQYQNTQQPMLTGVLQTNLAANTFIYNKNGSQDVSAGIYRTMQIGGTSTPNNKTLQGNITVATAYSVTGNAVLVFNGFTKS